MAFGQRLWALSGQVGGSVLSNHDFCDFYDPLAKTWSLGPALPAGSVTSAVAGNRIWVFQSGTLSYTNATGTSFSAVGGATYPVGNEARAVGLNGRLYVLGGTASAATGATGAPVTLATVQSLDATAAIPPATLTPLAPMLADRARFGVVATTKGKIYVFGGDQYYPVPSPFGNMAGFKSTSAVEEYTP